MMDWYGTLTIENLEYVANSINEVLQGERFTWVAVSMSGNESRPGFLIGRPQVRTSEYLTGENPKVWYSEDGKRSYGGFHFNDSYGVWGCSTSNHNPEYDWEFNAPYVVIERKKIEITHRAPAGHILYWTLAVERSPHD